MQMGLICPVCGRPLHREGKTCRCPSGHLFDISAKGHVNLLTDKHKNSLAPGDNRDMVDARRRFLATGGYASLGDALGEIACSHRQELQTLVDVGCGEGTWTLAIQQALARLDGTHPPNQSPVSLFGMDISKEAILRAAGKDKTIQWVVASLFHLPLADGSADALFNVFAPSADTEFARVLRPDGLLVTAIPGRFHLWGLKQALYDRPRENDETFPPLPSFCLAQTFRVDTTLQVDSQAVMADLLAMTPYAWKSPKAGQERYAALTRLETPVSFVIAVHRKRV